MKFKKDKFMSYLNVKKLYSDAVTPSKLTEFSSGFDICAYSVLKHYSTKIHFNGNKEEILKESITILNSFDKYEIKPNERVLIGTGISVCIMDTKLNRAYNFDIQIRPRSGLGINHGIHVAYGTIDPDYNGEICIIIFNLSVKSFFISKDQRLAQLIITKSEPITVIETLDLNELPSTKRGLQGFGHTGL